MSIIGGLRTLGGVVLKPFEARFGVIIAAFRRSLELVELEALRADRHRMRSFSLSASTCFGLIQMDIKQRDARMKGWSHEMLEDLRF